MAKAIDILIDQDFVSDLDTDENKTTWIIRTLSGLEFLSCVNAAGVDHQKVLELGLTGWKDFPDADGSEIEFSKPNIGRISAELLQDISFKIQGISSLSEEDAKNS